MNYKIMSISLLLWVSSSYCERQQVIKKVLDNGLTILIYPADNTQKVSVQIWYNVGSKHETNEERGLAHLLLSIWFLRGLKNYQRLTYH